MKSSAVVVCSAVGLNVAVAVALLAAQMRLYAVLGQMSYGEAVLAAEMWVGNLWGWLLAAFAGAGVLTGGYVLTGHGGLQ
ncbi:hypothetical protein [Streptomyces sp. NPDC002619]|uniref:hypothetical protein n=1 Tax=Streptomyces sp. NPDC002619 TaxID=3364655 RepID=UPI0036A06144